jgi:hypothetical protein|tara:strand:+ start:530 stop:1072 length:543 start_codon:yes stop_codon:yes gene_type:complete
MKTVILKKIPFLVLLIITLFYLNSCGIYRKTDARKVSPNADERVKQNMKEGKGLTLGKALGGGKGGDFMFASSNEMWRATIEILEFVPLSNVDYGGGIIITDWYSEESGNNNSSIKIVVQFMSNEIRSDGLKISTYKKKCNDKNVCNTVLSKANLSNEIKLAILKKATQIKSKDQEKKNN